ncbi:signal peptidase I [Arthrobacter sp. AZCC_0090]|uniref:signal peptidase I n=1 Tax=Arthrobacter sp. AZCC_0090 TaxID=2735881 RepID=UPI001610EF8E|nr:signal peptidase I [Arthrobacter sp. AZCC_0090]MBB6403779.1 signal peptidase [Arthrobacter sp. AZCC_0090]
MTLPDGVWEDEEVTVDEAYQVKTRVHPAVRVYGAFRSTVLTLGAILGVASILTFGVSLLFGVRPLVVVSGSMEPTIPVGSVVFSAQTAAGEIQEGTVVTVDRPRNLGLVTHRLVKSVETAPDTYEYTLKGDANSKEDPEPYKVKTVGKYVWHVVALGYLAEFLQSRNGTVIAIGASLALIALFILDPARLTNRSAGRRRATAMTDEGEDQISDESRS